MPINREKKHRLYRQERLHLRSKKRRRITSGMRVAPQAPTGPNQLWTMDFVHDNLHDNLACGRAFRALNVMDGWSREALAIEADTSLNGQRVVRVLEQLVARRGQPQLIQVDNGSEFRSIALDRVPSGRGLSQPGQTALHRAGKAHSKRPDRILQRQTTR